MSNTLNLNAKRAARAAARQESLRVEIGDQTFELVAEMPIALMTRAMNNDLEGALRLLLAHADEDWDRLLACDPSFQDVMDIIEFYGASLGESSRSGGSSTSTGGPSKPTGSGGGEISLPTYGEVLADVGRQAKDFLTSAG